MKKNKLVRPILKWVGGKRQLLEEIEKRLPKRISYYVEPFVGGGAVLFDRQPQYVRINDYNKELINVYRVVRDNPDALIEELKNHEKKNDESGSEWFYFVRGIDRTPEFENLSDVKRAARIIYLNKTCYNGLFRVNSAGQLNVPYGRYKHPNIVNEVGIRALHGYFCNADIEMREGDFADCLIDLPKGAFVYLDPPYRNTTSYKGAKGLDYDELYDWLREASQTCKVFVSEYQMPDDFKLVAEFPQLTQLCDDKGKQFVSIEKVFTL